MGMDGYFQKKWRRATRFAEMIRLNKAARKENAGGQEQDASEGVTPWEY